MNALTVAFQPQQPLDHAGAAAHPSGFKLTENRKRAEAATSLCMSIANCDPEDACWIMAAALRDLGPGQPFPPLFGFLEAANEWADWASVPELKAYALAAFNHLPPCDQSAFLAYVGATA